MEGITSNDNTTTIKKEGEDHKDAEVIQSSSSVVHDDAQKDEKEEKKKEEKAEIDTLDLVFAVDCTGSMGSYIMAAQENIRNIIDGVVREEQVNVRFGLVCYRDHPVSTLYLPHLSIYLPTYSSLLLPTYIHT